MASAPDPTPACAIVTNGEGEAVTKVSVYTVDSTALIICLPAALCSEGFCKNGGSCLYPNVNCTCLPEWKGSTCRDE